MWPLSGHTQVDFGSNVAIIHVTEYLAQKNKDCCLWNVNIEVLCIYKLADEYDTEKVNMTLWFGA